MHTDLCTQTKQLHLYITFKVNEWHWYTRGFVSCSRLCPQRRWKLTKVKYHRSSSWSSRPTKMEMIVQGLSYMYTWWYLPLRDFVCIFVRCSSAAAYTHHKLYISKRVKRPFWSYHTRGCIKTRKITLQCLTISTIFHGQVTDHEFLNIVIAFRTHKEKSLIHSYSVWYYSELLSISLACLSTPLQLDPTRGAFVTMILWLECLETIQENHISANYSPPPFE